MATGARVWCFPDGYLPTKVGDGTMESHEALMLLNVGQDSADVKLDIFFEDRDPTLDIPIAVEGCRVKCVRLDRPEDIGGVHIPPLTQYSLRVRSNRKIVAQFGRLDATQTNLAYYVGVGHWEE